MTYSKALLPLAVAAAIAIPSAAFATNGMNLEGYGPIAAGMGGASMAYDNGTAAMMNNPATLGLMKSESGRFDLAVGVLGPDVESKAPAAMGGQNAQSGGDSYLMPAIGWVTKREQLTWGVGVFAQGGMGTEYESGSWLAAGTGQEIRSELGVGRLMFPVAFNVNENVTVGGSIDYVWGGLDLKLAMPLMAGGGAGPGTFADFVPTFGGNQVLGAATVSGGLAGQIAGAMAAGYDTVALNFSDGSDFTEEAKGAGFAGKIGAVFQVNPNLSVGATYHLKTAMSDWEGDADMVLYDTNGAQTPQAVPGTIKVKDFQWPTTMALGVAFTPNDRLLLAADVKVLKWSDVMKDFTMTFEPDGAPGQSAEITFFQDWDDQTVISLGGAYQVNEQLTVRLGANLASNPVPDEFVHPLFPATIENHYTAGFGYAFSEANGVNFSLAYAPEVSVTNSNTQTKISHSQLNWQVMYSHHF